MPHARSQLSIMLPEFNSITVQTQLRSPVSMAMLRRFSDELVQ